MSVRHAGHDAGSFTPMDVGREVLKALDAAPETEHAVRAFVTLLFDRLVAICLGMFCLDREFLSGLDLLGLRDKRVDLIA